MAISPPALTPPIKYLAGYPAELHAQVHQMVEQGRLGALLDRKYPERHDVRTDPALYDYISEIKGRYLRMAPPLAKAVYDPKLRVLQQALGTHTAVSRVQGGKLKAKREIRIAHLFRDAPPEFLRMIVVHELAHLKEREHDRAFYQLCVHMEPDYHQLEFDVRLHLLRLDVERAGAGAADAGPPTMETP